MLHRRGRRTTFSVDCASNAICLISNTFDPILCSGVMTLVDEDQEGSILFYFRRMTY